MPVSLSPSPCVCEREGGREQEGESETVRQSRGDMADNLQGMSLRTKASGRGLLCTLCYHGYGLPACVFVYVSIYNFGFIKI